jgi:hypothetical protein
MKQGALSAFVLILICCGHAASHLIRAVMETSAPQI